MTSLSPRLAAALLAACASLAPPLAHAEARQEALTLDRAIALALENQPTLRVQAAQVEAARGRIDQARVARRPTVTVSAAGSAGSTQARVINSGQTLQGGFFEPFLGTGLTASATWRLYDFGLTAANIRAAEASAAATEAAGGTNTLDIQSQVAIAYLEAVARQRLIAVADATVVSELRHVDEARRFVAAQAKDPIEVSQAVARAATARSTLAQAQSDAAVAMANLRSAVGLFDPETTLSIDAAWPTAPAAEPPPLPALVGSARTQRPEIVAFDKQIAAAEASITAAAATRRPTLNATARTAWDPDTRDPGRAPSWNAGITLQWQVYDGGRAAADVRVARANLASVQAQRDALVVTLTSQLDAARARIIANRANVSASTEAVTAARAQLQLAEARYRQGLGSQIELADAQFAVTSAEGNMISAEWQLADAWAQLRRATGRW